MDSLSNWFNGVLKININLVNNNPFIREIATERSSIVLKVKEQVFALLYEVAVSTQTAPVTSGMIGTFKKEEIFPFFDRFLFLLYISQG